MADADALAARQPVAAAANRVAARWAEQGAATGTAIGFDGGVLTAAAGRQAQLESAATPGLLAVTEPTATAVAAAFMHAAVLAAKPRNASVLAEASRMFGRIAHLLDAVDDLDGDRRSGRHNPLLATGTSIGEARAHGGQALLGLRLAVADLDLGDRRLVEVLLVTQVGRSIDRTFRQAGFRHIDPHGPAAPADAQPQDRPARDWWACDCCGDCCCNACCDACCNF